MLLEPLPETLERQGRTCLNAYTHATSAFLRWFRRARSDHRVSSIRSEPQVRNPALY
jgi:hypothetical protein